MQEDHHGCCRKGKSWSWLADRVIDQRSVMIWTPTSDYVKLNEDVKCDLIIFISFAF